MDSRLIPWVCTSKCRKDVELLSNSIPDEVAMYVLARLKVIQHQDIMKRFKETWRLKNG